jgi:diguanylate cyclase (GGDEF)-like protein
MGHGGAKTSRSRRADGILYLERPVRSPRAMVMSPESLPLRPPISPSDLRTTRRVVALGAMPSAAAPAHGFLVVIAGFRLGDCVPLVRGRQVVGRDRSAALSLPDESVSRFHAALTVGAQEVLVEDLESTNGCLLNGVPTTAAVLRNGDQIALGDVVLRYFDGSCREGAYHLAVYEQTSRDALTGLLNRRRILQRAADSLTLASSHGQSIAVVMVDTDRFKQVNDRLGHAAGDRLLRQIGDALRSALRGDSYVGRLGGDEFLAVLADIDAAAARIAGARVTARVRSLEIDGLAEFGRPSVSLGIALSDPHRDEGIDALIERADQALLEAKRQGRDRLVLAPPAA